MKFKIYSTSGNMEKHSIWGKLQEKYLIKEKQGKYFIEINSMEKLLELCKLEDIIIHDKGYDKDVKDFFCIEIYDYYRE